MTPDEFMAAPVIPEVPSPEDEVPRDRWGRPLITAPDGKRQAYNRASSFGQQIEDKYRLELWKNRQTARGMAIKPELALAAPHLDEPEGADKKRLVKIWDSIVEQAQDTAGSNVKSAIGTAIHKATEIVDLGGSLDGLSPLLVERANSYYRFCQENNIQRTSVEQFGVEDVHRVAGTWDRTGWWQRRHKIIDVKTSSSMAFAGIGFAVQLAEYAHMFKYDLLTGERTPHEVMDLEEGIIIHVDREMNGPIELYSVDLTVGWEYAKLVQQVKTAQKEGTSAIRAVEPLSRASAAIMNCETIEQLRFVYAQSGPTWVLSDKLLAQRVAAEIRGAA